MAVLMRVLLASTALAERPEGLTALFDSNAMDDRGVIALPITQRITRGSRNALLVLHVIGMRSAKGDAKAKLAIIRDGGRQVWYQDD